MMPLGTLKRNCPETNSPSNKKNSKLEIDLVSKKVEKTKQEIQQLKLELQKLINTGLQTEISSKTELNKNFVSSERIAQHNIDCNVDSIVNNTFVSDNIGKSKIPDEETVPTVKKPDNIEIKNNILCLKNSDSNIPEKRKLTADISTKYNYLCLRRYDVPINSNNNEVKIECQKKKSEYDKIKAREFIKKQRERRAEEMKNKLKGTKDDVDIKKQKLKELHEKSQKLVSQNLKHKRERSKSREILNRNKEGKEFIQNNAQDNLAHGTIHSQNTVNCDLVDSACKSNVLSKKYEKSEISHIKSPQKNQIEKKTLENRIQNKHKSIKDKIDDEKNNFCSLKMQTLDLKETVKPHFRENYDRKRIEAATKIQAYYKGYKQRKHYQSLLKKQHVISKKESAIQVDENSLENPKLAWLETPNTMPYPYNFINAVKRKLSHVVQNRETEKNSSVKDLSLKSNDKSLKSNDKSFDLKENINEKEYFENKIIKGKQIEKVSASNSESDCVSKNKTKVFVANNINFLRSYDIPNEKEDFLEKALQNDSSKSIEKETNRSSKSNLRQFLSRKCLNLDLKSIEPLSLKVSHINSQNCNGNLRNDDKSDSDTSKNIPEISSESSIHTDSKNHNDSYNIDEFNLEFDPKKFEKLKFNRRKITTVNDTLETLFSKENDQVTSKNSKNDSDIYSASTQSESQKINTKNSTNTQFEAPDLKKQSSIVQTVLSKEKVLLNEKEELNDNVDSDKGKEPENSIMQSFVSYMKSIGVETFSKSNVSKPTTEPDQYSSNNKLELIKKSESSSSISTSFSIPKGYSTSVDTGNIEAKSEIAAKSDDSKYSSDFSSLSTEEIDHVPSLKPPSIKLNTSHVSLHKTNSKQIPDLIIQPDKSKAIETKIDSNEIHLKFEAEIRLLHHFNESLQEAVEKEKSLIDNCYIPKNKVDIDYPKSNNKTKNDQELSRRGSEIQVMTINYSRGSDVLNESPPMPNLQEPSDVFDTSVLSTDFRLSSLKSICDESSIQNEVNTSISTTKSNRGAQLYSGISLKVFDQLIRDEDARIENLKTILKIREKALLDRTKSELAWLEIQKRHLRDSGQLNEISMIKKKQRGLLVKLQHERHEMQRLKQMQKAASKERKTLLRQQRNVIKAQLSTNKNLVKLKPSSSRERKRSSSGPMKVLSVHSCSESMVSETSSFKRNGSVVNEEMVSVVSRTHSIVSSHMTDLVAAYSDDEDFNAPTVHNNTKSDTGSNKNENFLKRSLLMRETALQKRRKIAEELLQWHQRLVEEERQITELETAANSIINQVPPSQTKSDTNFTFKGSQLNLMWLNMTGKQEQRFNDNELYIMSKEALVQFCKDARNHVSKKVDLDNNLKSILTDLSNDLDSHKSESSISSSKEDVTEKLVEDVKNIPNDSKNNYSEDFEESLSENTKSQIFSLSSVSNAVVNDDLSKTLKSQARSSASLNCENIDEVLTKQTTSITNLSNKDVDTIKSRIPSEKSSSINEKLSNDTNFVTESEYHSKENIITDDLSENKLAESQNIISNNDKHQEKTENDFSFKISEIQPFEDQNSEDNSKSTTEYNSDEKQSDVGNLKTDSKVTTENSAKLLLKQDDSFMFGNKSDSHSKTEVPSIKLEQNISEVLVHESEILTQIPTNEIESKIDIQKFPNNELNSIEKSIKSGEYLDGFIENDPVEVIENKEDSDSDSVSEKKSYLNASKIDFCLADVDENKVSLVSENLEASTSRNIEDLPELSNYGVVINDDEITSADCEEIVEDNPNSSFEIKENISEHECNCEQKSSNKLVINGNNSEDDTQYNLDTLKELNEEEDYYIDICNEEQSNIINNLLENSDLYIKSENNENIDINSVNSHNVKSYLSSPKSKFSFDEVQKSGQTEYTEDFCKDNSSDINDENRKIKSNESSSTVESQIVTNCDEEQVTDMTGADERNKEENIEPKSHSEKDSDNYSDVRKRIFEILSETNSRKNGHSHSPNIQEIYTTTYDVSSPVVSSESERPVKTEKQNLPKRRTYSTAEEEELLQKQLAIEQEIKQIEQQQKEHLPYMFLREIPNKPPPPYKPPAPTPVIPSVLPSSAEQINLIVHQISSYLYNAYLNKSLPNVTLLSDIKKALHGQVEPQCQIFVFDLCKELTIEHYKQFDQQSGPIWMQIKKRPKLVFEKPFDERGLEKFLMKKVKETLGYENVNRKESMIIKWSRKKRDHVDELLVLESQTEEVEWTNYDKDELIVINELTNDIMNSLIKETGQILKDILAKKLKDKA